MKKGLSSEENFDVNRQRLLASKKLLSNASKPHFRRGNFAPFPVPVTSVAERSVPVTSRAIPSSMTELMELERNFKTGSTPSRGTWQWIVMKTTSEKKKTNEVILSAVSVLRIVY